MAYNPFRPLAEDQLKRVQPYAQRKPEYPGFEGVRQITSDEDEDFKDMLTFNPDALRDPDAIPTPEQSRMTTPDKGEMSLIPELMIDREKLAEAAVAIENSPVGKEDAFFNPMDYLTQEQRATVLGYFDELAKMENYREPGAVGILKKLEEGNWLSQAEQVHFVIYLRSWEVFVGDAGKRDK